MTELIVLFGQHGAAVYLCNICEIFSVYGELPLVGPWNVFVSGAFFFWQLQPLVTLLQP